MKQNEISANNSEMEEAAKSSINISYFVDFETNSVGSGKELKSSMK